MKIQIGELVFASKAGATAHFQRMLHRYELGDVVDDADARQLLWLLERHPNFEQKRGVGIAGFTVAAVAYAARGFLITRADGSCTDFSYRKCIDGSATLLSMVVAALRAEVQEDVLQAKRSYFDTYGDAAGRVPCRLTGKPVAADEAHADHAPPFTFNVLATTFLDARKLVADETLLTSPSDNQFGRLLRDRTLAADWRAFHHKHADLRIVCKLEHVTRSQLDRPQPENRQLVLPPR
jgi:hypothetical protein